MRYSDRSDREHQVRPWYNQHIVTDEGERGKVTWAQLTDTNVVELHVQTRSGWAFRTDSEHATITHEHEEEISNG